MKAEIQRTLIQQNTYCIEQETKAVLTPAIWIKQDVDWLWVGENSSVCNSARAMAINCATGETRVNLV